MPPEALQRLWRKCLESGRRCAVCFCPVCTAPRRHEPPYWGVQGGRSPPALLSPHFFGKKWGPRPGRPAPPGVPRRIAGDHRSPLHRRPKLRIIRFRVNAKAHSLRWASSPHDDHSVGSPRGPHWVRRVVPQGTFSCPVGAIHLVAPHGASSYRGKRADDIRPRGTGDHRSPLRMPSPVGMGKAHPIWPENVKNS